MQATQASSMQDQCKVLYYAGAPDGFNIPSPVFTPGPVIFFGFQATGQTELTEGDVAETTAKLRLPLGTVISPLDRVEIVARYGAVDVEPLIYEVIGQPTAGPSGLVVDLALLTTQQWGQQ